MPTVARKIALKDSSLRAMKAAPTGKRVTVWDALMPNMAVRVTDKGKRSFYAVKRRAGDTSPTWHLLGAYPVMSLGKAREKAREALLLLDSGQNPKTLADAERRATAEAAREAKANTFAATVDAYARHQLPDMRPSSARIYRHYLQRLTDSLGKRPIAEIRRRDVIAIIDEIRERSGPSAARTAMAVLGRTFNWAISRDLLEMNPASGINTNDVIGRATSRDRILKDAEIAAVWRATDGVGEPFATIYRLLLLTGLRLNEIAAVRWDDLDMEAGTLEVPAARAKNGVPMLVTLPPMAVALLAAVPRFTGPFVFTTTSGRRPVSGFSHGKARLDAVLTAQGASLAAFVVHDFRRVVRSGLSALRVRNEVAEACLGHKRKGIEGTYDRHEYIDEKRDALRLWETHLMRIVAPPPEPYDENVVSLRARA